MAVNATPPLTTVYQPGREKGATAAALVALLLDGGDASHRSLETKLAIRASTGAPRGAAPLASAPLAAASRSRSG
jgi:DNA-binding LacI/PurR family transcriptional regulator